MGLIDRLRISTRSLIGGDQLWKDVPPYSDSDAPRATVIVCRGTSRVEVDDGSGVWGKILTSTEQRRSIRIDMPPLVLACGRDPEPR